MTTRRAAMALAGVALLVVAGLSLLLQIGVRAPGATSDRACGSALDAAVDRSGWEAWWTRDVDDPDPAVRAALVRTTQCPDAVNRRVIVAAGALVVGAGLLAASAVPTIRSRRGALDTGGPLDRVRTVGAVTAGIGLTLTVAGLVAVAVLVADADSTLFLYTDRLVVALAGIVVIVPAIALAVGGWALRAVGRALEGRLAD